MLYGNTDRTTLIKSIWKQNAKKKVYGHGKGIKFTENLRYYVIRNVHDLHRSCIFMVVKSRKLKWGKHTAQWGKKINKHKR